MQKLETITNFCEWAQNAELTVTIILCENIFKLYLQVSRNNQYICLIKQLSLTVEFFAFNTKLAEMEILVPKDFTAAKKLPPVRLHLMITGSRV